MYKNFGTVFRFTFRNQAGNKGFKALTIVAAIILFLIPVAILFFTTLSAKNSKDKKLDPCGAETIYVADTITTEADFSFMRNVEGEGYGEIKYVTVASVEDALQQIRDNGEKKAFVLEVKEDEKKNISTSIIIPDGSEIKSDQAKNYNEAIDKMSMQFVVAAENFQAKDMVELSRVTDTDIFNAQGWASGDSLSNDKDVANEQNNQRIKDVFAVILLLLDLMVMYFIVLAYGASISKNIVMEKSSKLMDTMLISVKPKTMIFGKLTGVLAAGIMQLMIWILAVILGVVAGIILSEKVFPGVDNTIITFLKSLGALNLFQPLSVVLAILVLIFGIVLYASLAAIAGAIANTLQQAASNQGIFVIILIISFFLVMAKGMGSELPTWLCLFPFTGALCLPAAMLLGSVSTGIAIGGSATIIVLALLLVALSGRIYKAMALYKGTDAGIGKAIKILRTKN